MIEYRAADLPPQFGAHAERADDHVIVWYARDLPVRAAVAAGREALKALGVTGAQRAMVPLTFGGPEAARRSPAGTAVLVLFAVSALAIGLLLGLLPEDSTVHHRGRRVARAHGLPPHRHPSPPRPSPPAPSPSSPHPASPGSRRPLPGPGAAEPPDSGEGILAAARPPHPARGRVPAPHAPRAVRSRSGARPAVLAAAAPADHAARRARPATSAAPPASSRGSTLRMAALARPAGTARRRHGHHRVMARRHGVRHSVGQGHRVERGHHRRGPGRRNQAPRTGRSRSPDG